MWGLGNRPSYFFFKISYLSNILLKSRISYLLNILILKLKHEFIQGDITDDLMGEGKFIEKTKRY